MLLSALPRQSLVFRATFRPAARLHTSPSSKMPLFICYCPDYPNNLAARSKARDAHLQRAAKDKQLGPNGESPTSGE